MPALKLFDWDSWVVSVQATGRVPGTSDRFNPAAIGYTDPQADIRGLVGRSFNLGAVAGLFRHRARAAFPHRGRARRISCRFHLWRAADPGWLLLAQSFNVVSEGAGTWGIPSYDYYKFQLSAVYQVTPAVAVQFGGFTAYHGAQHDPGERRPSRSVVQVLITRVAQIKNHQAGVGLIEPSPLTAAVQTSMRTAGHLRRACPER